jgi:hypothetical protein
MTVIKVPEPPKSAFNKNRPVSALLKNQILHLHEAELRFPARDQTNIYINNIKTEGQAAQYIRQVTAKLHPTGIKQKRFAIAAVGENKPARKSSPKKSLPKKNRKTKPKPNPKKKSPRNKKR